MGTVGEPATVVRTAFVWVLAGTLGVLAGMELSCAIAVGSGVSMGGIGVLVGVAVLVGVLVTVGVCAAAVNVNFSGSVCITSPLTLVRILLQAM